MFWYRGKPSNERICQWGTYHDMQTLVVFIIQAHKEEDKDPFSDIAGKMQKPKRKCDMMQRELGARMIRVMVMAIIVSLWATIIVSFLFWISLLN